MNKIGDSWEESLLRNHFEEPEETLSRKETVRRSRWGKIDKFVEIKPDTSTQEDSEEVISEKLVKIRKKTGIKERRN